MGIVEKQEAIKDFLFNIDDTVVLQFNMSKQFKTCLGKAYLDKKKIMITSYCFKFTLDSMKHCILHELAHLYSYSINGNDKHNKEFVDIKNMLIKDYGTKEIAMSNTSTSKAYSTYDIDYE